MATEAVSAVRDKEQREFYFFHNGNLVDKIFSLRQHDTMLNLFSQSEVVS
jgi:hypothetical protein